MTAKTSDLNFDQQKFERFVDELIPAGKELEWCSLDDLARLLRCTRDYLEREAVPSCFQAELAEAIVRPFFAGKNITGRERVEIKQKLSAALGFDVPIPS